jgi:TetR/AcrR family transcriptional repressor of nem operon
LGHFSAKVNDRIEDAIKKAQSTGEFSENAPIKDIQLQIVIIIGSAGSITMDAGSFGRVEQLCLTHLRLVNLGYGGKRGGLSEKPETTTGSRN